MRIPFPVHVSLWRVVCFATILCGIQLLQGTSPYFSLCCFLFIFIAAIAFNVAGGFSRTTGAYVFFYAVLSVILGLCWKAIIGERADSNLALPMLTIRVFLGGITAMLASVFISRKLVGKRALLQNLVTDNNMQNATIGCMVTGLVIYLIAIFFPWQNGSVFSALAQINRFFPMAIILGVIHQIRKSNGTRSLSAPVLISGAAIFIFGVIGFSKEGMFTPLVCWIIAAGSQRYKVSLFQFFGVAIMVVLMFQFLVPYSQYGRNFRSQNGSFGDDARTAFFAPLQPQRTPPRSQRGHLRSTYTDQLVAYYNTSQGFLDRLQMIAVDDSLINEVTERNGTFGYSPIIMGFENLVPPLSLAQQADHRLR